MKVSFCIFTYNQEAYVEETIKSVLNQTYSPLEIIISDDCSTDNTFPIIQKIAKEYNGNHTIKTNQNKHNLGIGVHASKVFHEITSGDFLITLGGDDYVVNNHVEFAVNKMLEFKNENLIDFSGTVIDYKGNFLRKISLDFDLKHYNIDDYLSLKTIKSFAPGRIFRRKLLDSFQPIASNRPTEDAILVFRSLITTGLLRINAPLVYYRKHKTSITSSQGLSRFSNHAIISQHIKDVLHFYDNGNMSDKQLEIILIRLNYELKRRILSFSNSKNKTSQIIKMLKKRILKIIYLVRVKSQYRNE